MRFLLDVCVSSRSLTSFLQTEGHDVVSALSIDPKSTDEELLRIAFQDDRILITEDKDFGELVFVQRLPHGPIVRVVELSVEQQIHAIADLLSQHSDTLKGPMIVTLTHGRIRIRHQS